MSRLLLVLLLAGAAAVACSEDSSTKDNAGTESSNTATVSNQQNAEENGQVEGALRCLTPRDYVTNYIRETPEEAAVVEACEYAEDIKEIDFQPLRVEISDNTGRTAKGRVVGYSESCASICPGEIQISYDLFLSGDGDWEVKSDLFTGFEESSERQSVENQLAYAQVNKITVRIPNLRPELDEGAFCTTVLIEQPPGRVWPELLVDLPNGQTDMEYSRNPNSYGSEICFSQLPGPDGLYRLERQIYRWNGAPVTIKAYRLGSNESGENVRGDWVYITQ